METTIKAASLISSLFLGMVFISSTATAEVHGTVSVTSNYLGRGYSKSDGHFAYFANADYQHASGFYAGSSIAYVDFGDTGFSNRAHVEIVPYLGLSLNLSDDWRFDTQLSRYFYDGKLFGQSSEYNELYFFLHFRELFSATVSFSEDYYQRGHASGNYELNGRYPITDYLEFSAGAGYTQTKQTLEYDFFYWNAGVTFFYKFLSLDLRFADAVVTATEPDQTADGQSDNYPSTLTPTLLFTLSASF